MGRTLKIGDKLKWLNDDHHIYNVIDIKLGNRNDDILEEVCFEWVDEFGIKKKLWSYSFIDLNEIIESGFVKIIGTDLSPVMFVKIVH